MTTHTWNDSFTPIFIFFSFPLHSPLLRSFPPSKHHILSKFSTSSNHHIPKLKPAFPSSHCPLQKPQIYLKIQEVQILSVSFLKNFPSTSCKTKLIIIFLLITEKKKTKEILLEISSMSPWSVLPLLSLSKNSYTVIDFAYCFECLFERNFGVEGRSLFALHSSFSFSIQFCSLALLLFSCWYYIVDSRGRLSQIWENLLLLLLLVCGFTGSEFMGFTGR